jgi:hypothetical protein
MPQSGEDKAEKRAERLEREAHDAIEFRLEGAIIQLREALAIPEAAQGDGHPDLIWTLSLWIEALQWKHRSESALEAARLANGASHCAGPRLSALRTSWPAPCENWWTSIPSNATYSTRTAWRSFIASWTHSRRGAGPGRRPDAWPASF